MKTESASDPPRRGTRGFWPMRDLPMVGWLVAAAVVVLAHPLFPAPRWLLIHLVLTTSPLLACCAWERRWE